MPRFDIVKEVKAGNTFRVNNVVNNFDLDIHHINEHFTGNIDIEGREWNVGLIVGGSGTGKSTIAKECFPADYIDGYTYTAQSVIDDMPKDKSIKEIEKVFTSVGFASPPSWLKPYEVLSNGEKMRVNLARAILDERETVVFDEFTSVVNREVAKTASYAISKAVRRLGKRFVAVACHRDIVEWLEPDWIYDTDERRFFMFGESTTAPKSNWKYIGLTTQLKAKFGKCLGSTII